MPSVLAPDALPSLAMLFIHLDSSDPPWLQVDGRLTTDGIPELLRACRAHPGAVGLELAGLQAADDEGLVALKRLAEDGLELRGANPYLTLLLEAGARPSERPE